jgi:DNA-binding transcriptional LysR family regulator
MQNWAFILGGKPAPVTDELMQRRAAKLQGSEMNWDDIRYVVALYREGSISAVARQFRVDKTTVTRRLKAMEGQLGTTLFERQQGRWTATTSGQAVLAKALEIEEQIASLVRISETTGEDVSGVVRVTALDFVAKDFLLPGLTNLLDRYPALRIELVTSDQSLSLARREADIALRFSRPQDGNLIIRRVANIPFSIYVSADHLPDERCWVAYDHNLADLPESRWLSEHQPDATIRFRNNSLTCLLDAARLGLGKAILPVHMAAQHKDLQRWQETGVVVERDLWLVIHPESRNAPKIKAVSDWIVGMFKAGSVLAG